MSAKKSKKRAKKTPRRKAVKLTMGNLNTRLSGVEDFLSKQFPG